MRRVFIDTSAWDAIADSGDSNHEIALVFRDEIAGQCQLVTTKNWSFTDCTSYVVIRRLDIAEVFAFDQHFAQMGFVCRP